MRCSEAVQQLHLYFDHRLTLKQVRTLEAHIVSCSACYAEMLLLQEVTQSLEYLGLVAEPADMTARIMKRVAVTPQARPDPSFSLLRPSLAELLAVIFLATISTLEVISGQPALRSGLPIANGHDWLSLAFLNLLHLLGNFDMGTLMLAFWVIGTILGVCITLIVAGAEMRTTWIKAMIDRLPVW